MAKFIPSAVGSPDTSKEDFAQTHGSVGEPIFDDRLKIFTGGNLLS